MFLKKIYALKKNISNNVIKIFWRERRRLQKKFFIYFKAVLLIFISYTFKKKKKVLKTADIVLFNVSQIFIFFL